MDIVGRRDRLHQHRIDCDAYKDQESLKCQREKRAKIILSDLSPLAVCQRGKRDRREADGQVYLDHSSVNDNKDNDREDPHAQIDDIAFQP